MSDRAKDSELGLKYKCLRYYSGGPPVCAVCGEIDLYLLTLDHKDNNGEAERQRYSGGRGGGSYYRSLRERGYPDLNLQVLCKIHNFKKDRPQTRKIHILVEYDSVESIKSVEIKTLWEELDG